MLMETLQPHLNLTPLTLVHAEAATSEPHYSIRSVTYLDPDKMTSPLTKLHLGHK